MEFSLTGTPEIAPKLYWHNSANVLCNYMKKPEFLEIILKNQAIIPRYVIEPLDYWNIEGLKRIAFPMTCFCDIPFSKVGNHMTLYGRYGIALDKQQIINKFKVQPIHYMILNHLFLMTLKKLLHIILDLINEYTMRIRFY